MNDSEVVLLDPLTDAPVGTMDKLGAHRQGRYHAAVSVFLFDRAGRQILQQRSSGKYHAPGLWSNACCTHPFAGEAPAAAARRRLMEEIGVECDLGHFGTIRYRAIIPAPSEPAGSLTEHEFVDLYAGIWDGDFKLNEDEVGGLRLQQECSASFLATKCTPWFEMYMNVFGKRIPGFLPSPGGSYHDFGYHDLVRDIAPGNR